MSDSSTASKTSNSSYSMPPSNPDQSESSPLNPIDGGGRRNPLLSLFGFVRPFLTIFFPSVTFTKFFVNGLLPPLADNLVPLFFIGNIPDQSGLALAAQFTFISVLVEVIQEGIVNSLFYYVGRYYEEERLKSLQALKLCLAVLGLLGCLLTVAILLLSPYLVDVMGTPSEITEATKHFLYWSSFSFPLFLLSAGLSNFLLITTSPLLILAQVVNLILAFLINLLLFGSQTWSLHWGVGELGHYKIIQTGLNCLVNFIFCLVIERMTPIHFLFQIPLISHLTSNIRSLFHISWGNFGDSAVRNFFYWVVTLTFINKLGADEVAGWNLLNSIVWGLLLIPSFTVSNYAKVRIGLEGTKQVIAEVAIESLKCLTGWLVLISLLAGFFWSDLAQFFCKSNEQAQLISGRLLKEMGWIFIVFSVNNGMDSLFFGVGKTKYVFYQSLITNLVIYLPPWLLYLWGVITPTYWLVVGLYIAGMLVDFCLTSFYCWQVWRSMEDV